MDVREILSALKSDGPLAREALYCATADRSATTPALIDAVRRCALFGEHEHGNELLFIFHLLGQWREKSAYRLMARLLRRPPDELDAIFGDTATETAHRVMAAVFDGDPQPLYDIVLDADADEFVRSRMCEALAMVTLQGELPRSSAAEFLRACYGRIEPQEECFVWHGWQSAIALLGLEELTPLVSQAFARGLVSKTWLSFHHFESDLRAAIDNDAAPSRFDDREFTLFGDAVEELSSWGLFRPKLEPEKDHIYFPDRRDWSVPQIPAVNPLRHVGRNDPCPCGSGKKYKKCCLNAAATSA